MKFFEFLIEKLSNPSPTEEPRRAMESSGIVLVTGATGGVGRRVVTILQKKGLPVRVLVVFRSYLVQVLVFFSSSIENVW